MASKTRYYSFSCLRLLLLHLFRMPVQLYFVSLRCPAARRISVICPNLISHNFGSISTSYLCISVSYLGLQFKTRDSTSMFASALATFLKHQTNSDSRAVSAGTRPKRTPPLKGYTNTARANFRWAIIFLWRAFSEWQRVARGGPRTLGLHVSGWVPCPREASTLAS